MVDVTTLRGLINHLRRIEDTVSDIEHHWQVAKLEGMRAELRNLNREVFHIRQNLEAIAYLLRH